MTMYIFLLFQRQWNHCPNFDVSTLLWRFHVSIGLICYHNSNRKRCLYTKDDKLPVQFCNFCHTTSVLPKWGYQFQKQGSTTGVVESFEKWTFSDIGRIPESKIILPFYYDYKNIPWTMTKAMKNIMLSCLMFIYTEI